MTKIKLPDVISTQENLYENLTTFRMLDKNVEKELMKNPIKVKGIGLSDEFHELFDKKEEGIVSYK